MRSQILLTSIKILIIASFFTPLIVSSNFIFPFVFPKTMVFQVLVEIMFFVWLLLAIEKPEFRPKRSKILFAIATFLAAMFLASLVGVDFAHSFWSNYERMTGLVTLLHYFAFFVVLTSVLKTKKDWLSIFDFFIGASLLVSFVALGQEFGIKAFILADISRLSSTLGNPAYLAAYLLFVLFFAAFMFFQRKSRAARYYYAAVFVFTFIIFFLTQTRGALLAFGGAAILFLLALALWPKGGNETESLLKFRRRIKKISLFALIFFVVIVSLIYLFKDSSFVKNSSTLSRLTGISIKEATTQTRLLAWKLSWKGFLERPVLGWGWENYNVVFNKYYDPMLYPTESWFDRAHDLFFDLLIAGGIFGLLAFALIFFAVFAVLWRAYRGGRIDFLNGALFAILSVAYLVQDLFVFDMLFSYLPLFLFLAFINWVGQKNENLPVKEKNLQSSAFLKIILAVVLIFLFYVVNLRPALAGFYGIRALSLQKQDPEMMLDAFKKSLDYGTFGRFEVRLQLFELAKNMMTSYENLKDKKPTQDFVEFALGEGEKTIKERPLDTRYLLIIGQMNLIASQIDQKYLLRANEILDVASKQSPNRQITLYSLGEAKLREGKIEEGIYLFKKAIALNENVQDSYFNLANIYFSIGDIKNGEDVLAQIQQKFGKISAENWQKFGNILVNGSQFDKAIEYIQRAIESSPNSTDFYASLANAYYQKGDKKNAKQAALKVAEIDPSRKEAVDQFIKSLGI